MICPLHEESTPKNFVMYELIKLICIYHFHDQMTTNVALLRGLLEARILKKKSRINCFFVYVHKKTHQVIFFTINSSENIIKCFPTKCSSALATNEARSMIKITHCLTSLSCSCNFFLARMTNPKVLARLFILLHFFLKKILFA